ncbi:MAG: MipA/OmpV family protein, partial [Robiginitomaculum sp.]|nr:MipA/OmpV family protein [Robiginitomaculum sp.]
NESFFGITANQAQSSPLAAFDIGSGIYAYSANVVTWIEFQDKYALSLIATYRKFAGDAKASPILRANDGATDGIYAAISITRKLDFTKF